MFCLPVPIRTLIESSTTVQRRTQNLAVADIEVVGFPQRRVVAIEIVVLQQEKGSVESNLWTLVPDKLATGLELDWIDIGTWELPKNAHNIVEQHREAWLMSLDNLNNRSPQTIRGIEKESQIETLHALLREIIMVYTTRKHAPDQIETINKLLHLYRQKLAIVQDMYRSSPDHKATPIPIIRSLSQLNDVLNLTHTLREK